MSASAYGKGGAGLGLIKPGEPASKVDGKLTSLTDQLETFWKKEMAACIELCNTNRDFKNHNDLPLARIKRIMKSDEDVRMIRAEAPVLFAKACELFILELTLRSSCYSEKTERRNLQKVDIRKAIANTDIFDFLHDVLTEKDREMEAKNMKSRKI